MMFRWIKRLFSKRQVVLCSCGKIATYKAHNGDGVTMYCFCRDCVGI